eukprot:UN34148
MLTTKVLPENEVCQQDRLVTPNGWNQQHSMSSADPHVLLHDGAGVKRAFGTSNKKKDPSALESPKPSAKNAVKFDPTSNRSSIPTPHSQLSADYFGHCFTEPVQKKEKYNTEEYVQLEDEYDSDTASVCSSYTEEGLPTHSIGRKRGPSEGATEIPAYTGHKRIPPKETSTEKQPLFGNRLDVKGKKSPKHKK